MAQTPYTFVQINQGFSPAMDVNDDGTVVGWWFGPKVSDQVNTESRGYVWTLATGTRPIITDPATVNKFPLYTAVNDPSRTLRINATGTVAGVGSDNKATIWTSAQGLVSLGSFDGGVNASAAGGLNDVRQVVGYSWGGGYNNSGPFIWSFANGLQALTGFSGLNGIAFGINNNGQVVGQMCCPAGRSSASAFIWSASAGETIIPDLPGAEQTGGFSINDSGVVVGRALIGADEWVVFRWSEATGTQNLNAPTGFVELLDINNAGDIVATIIPPAGGRAPYLYHNGSWTNLNNLLPGGTGFTLQFVEAINNRGWIVGAGTTSAPAELLQGFVLIPSTFEYPLAEGATGPFFDLDILLANPNLVAAPVTVTFLTPASGLTASSRASGQATVIQNYTLAPQSRLTIRVDDIQGLENTPVSTVVRSTNALSIVAERTMFWDKDYYGGHTEVTPGSTATKWYFAEGAQGFFDTYVLIGNGNSSPAAVTVSFLLEGGSPVVKTYTVAEHSRFNVFAGAIPELVGKSFSIVVDATIPIIAERAMYFGTRRFWDGGHESAGVPRLSTSWFHAEGATGAFFDTYILVGNPNPQPTNVTFTWLRDDGIVVTKTKSIGANARLTVNVESEDPLLANTAVSTTVSSSLPVISERAMYWPGGFSEWEEAHNSFGVTSTRTKWGLAEGRVGTARNYETYILLANGNATAAAVTIAFLRKMGAPVVKTFTVPASSRFNVHVNSMVPELLNEEFSAVINVTNGQPIAVERALYWDALGTVWAGGTNATAVPLP
jgi:hypothetical protein